MPVTSYAPEFLELYRRAAQAPVTIRLATFSEATKLRARLHTLRREMRKESHPMTHIANGVQISLVKGPTNSDPVDLIARPADASFIDAIREAGIDAASQFDGSTLPSEDDELPTERDDGKATEETLETFFRGERENSMCDK